MLILELISRFKLSPSENGGIVGGTLQGPVIPVGSLTCQSWLIIISRDVSTPAC